MRLDRFARSFVEGDEPPGRAVVDLTEKGRPHLRVVGLGDLIPHVAARIAKPAIGAKASRVEK